MRRWWVVALCVSFGSVAGAVAGAGAAEVLEEAAIARAAAVVDVTSDRHTVRGHVENRTGDELRDVELLLVHEFRWADEMNPGEDTPGRTERLTLGPVAPRASLPFVHAIQPPLPARADGRYVTRVEIMGLTQAPLPRVAPARPQ